MASNTKNDQERKILILYWSSTGNTEKVSHRIADTLRKEGEAVEIVKVEEDFTCNLYDYNLIFLGTPVIEFLPHKRILTFLKKKRPVNQVFKNPFFEFRQLSLIQRSSPTGKLLLDLIYFPIKFKGGYDSM